MAESVNYGHIISPLFDRLDLPAGETVTGSFTYTNAFFDSSVNSQDFTVLIAFIYQEDGTPTVYAKTPPALNQYDMSNWVTVTDEEFTLSKGEQKTIHYSIDIPVDPSPGGKYASIIILQTEQLDKDIDTGAVLNANIGFPLLGKIAGTESYNSEVLTFTSDKKVYLQWPQKPIIFTTTVQNNGNVDYLPGGDIFIHKGDLTKSFWNTTINEPDLVVLPNNTRSFTNEWTDSRPLVSIEDGGLFINTEYFRMGKYTATAKVGYDSNNKRLITDRVAEFWILPIPLIIAILSLILVIILGNILWRKLKSTN